MATKIIFIKSIVFLSLYGLNAKSSLLEKWCENQPNHTSIYTLVRKINLYIFFELTYILEN